MRLEGAITLERHTYMIPASYKPRKKYMELAISEAKRAGDRGDYPIGAVITRVTGAQELVIASAGNRVKTSGSSIKHVELETLKYVSSGYGRLRPQARHGILQVASLAHPMPFRFEEGPPPCPGDWRFSPKIMPGAV